MALVDLQDLAPGRVEVGLGLDADQVGAHAPGGLHELDLGGGELLAGVGDEQHRLGQGQRPHGDRGVGRAEAAHARGVDHHEPAAQHLDGQAHVDGLDAAPRLIAALPVLGDVAVHVVDRDLLAYRVGRVAVGVAAVVGRLEQHRRLGPLGPPDGGGHGGGDVVVDGAHVGAQQGVDQRALALLELPDHQDVERRVGQAGLGSGEAVAEVLALVGDGRLGGQVEGAQGALDQRRALDGAGGLSHRHQV